MKKTLIFTLVSIMLLGLLAIGASAENKVYELFPWSDGNGGNYFIDATGLEGNINATAYGAGSRSYLMRVDDGVTGYLRCNPSPEFGEGGPQFKINTAVVDIDLSNYKQIIVRWGVNSQSLVGEKNAIKITTAQNAETTLEMAIDDDHLCDTSFEVSKVAQNFASTTLDISGMSGKLTDMTFLPFDSVYAAGGTVSGATFYLLSIEFVEGQSDAGNQTEEETSAESTPTTTPSPAPETADATLLVALVAAVPAALVVVTKKRK